MTETLSSFWKKLQLGTIVKVTYQDTCRDKIGISIGNIVLVQTNAVARDGSNYDKSKQFTKEKPCWFRKPKASKVVVTENKIVEDDKQSSTIVTYEIMGINN